MKFSILMLFLISNAISAIGQGIDLENFNFDKADSIALSLKGERYSLEKLAVLLTGNLDSDVEKIRSIYKWIAENIQYDVVEFHKRIKVKKSYSYNRRRRYLKRTLKNISKKTLRKRKAICYGYAYLFKEMTSSVGIASHLVTGHAKNLGYPIGKVTRPDHAWNVVQLNNKYYPIDVTWSSGFTNKKVTHFTPNFNDFYFLTDPKAFIMDHYPEDKFWTLHKDPISLREFFNAPIALNGFSENKLNRFKPKKGIVRAKADSVVQFFFTTNKLSGLSRTTIRFLSIKNEEEIKDIPVIRKKLIKTDMGYIVDVAMPRKGRFEILVEIDAVPTFLYTAFIK